MVNKKGNIKHREEFSDPAGELNSENQEDKNIVSDLTESKLKAKSKNTRSRSKAKKSKGSKSSIEAKDDAGEKVLEDENEIRSTRDEIFVEYDEPEFELKEITSKDKEILIGPRRLTRFEKARITGARALQLSFGAPIMIKIEGVFNKSSIAVAIEELEKKALPISIRRILPNGIFQDIPLDWMTS